MMSYFNGIFLSWKCALIAVEYNVNLNVGNSVECFVEYCQSHITLS